MSQISNIEPRSTLDILFNLAIISKDQSFEKKIDPGTKMKHVAMAEQYCDEALAFAAKSTLVSEVERIRLEQAILFGRRAEIESKRGKGIEVVDSMKREAIDKIEKAFRRLGEVDRAKYRENELLVSGWITRLKKQ